MWKYRWYYNSFQYNFDFWLFKIKDTFLSQNMTTAFCYLLWTEILVLIFIKHTVWCLNPYHKRLETILLTLGVACQFVNKNVQSVDISASFTYPRKSNPVTNFTSIYLQLNVERKIYSGSVKEKAVKVQKPIQDVSLPWLMKFPSFQGDSSVA